MTSYNNIKEHLIRECEESIIQSTIANAIYYFKSQLSDKEMKALQNYESGNRTLLKYFQNIKFFAIPFKGNVAKILQDGFDVFERIYDINLLLSLKNEIFKLALYLAESDAGFLALSKVSKEERNKLEELRGLFGL